MRIKGVVFDFDGTLYSQGILRGLIIFSIAAEAVKNIPEGKRLLKVIKAFRKAHEELRKTPVTTGDLLKEQMLLTAKLTGEKFEYVKDIIEKWFFKKPLPILSLSKRAGLVKLMKWLKLNNYKIGIYSDYPVQDKIKALGLADYVGYSVSSCDSNVCTFKPDAKGFLEIAGMMELKPEEILFVGDRKEVDIDGAKGAGMEALLISAKDFMKRKHGANIFLKSVKQYLLKND